MGVVNVIIIGCVIFIMVLLVGDIDVMFGIGWSGGIVVVVMLIDFVVSISVIVIIMDR